MLTTDAERGAQLAPHVVFGIVTALEEERAAVCAMLDEPVHYAVPGRGAGLVYDLGEIPALGGGTHVVAVALAGMGNTIAAARGTLLLQHFKGVEAILMVGIAGGVPWPEKPDIHVRLGDVVVSDARGVVQFDFVKKTRRNVEYRFPPRPPCARLLESARYLAADARTGKRPWEVHIRRAEALEDITRPDASTDVLAHTARPDEVVAHPADPQRREGMPRIFHGVIGSSGTLLKDPKERDRLGAEFGVRAVEMEASGITDATWNHGVGFLAIRGICDYCDSHKNDIWHGYAALVAAAYMRALLERTASQTTNLRFKPKLKPDLRTPHNLRPRRLFVGRETELAALKDALTGGGGAMIRHSGQASMYGLGGVGKTALALEFAWRSLGNYPGGVYWIEAEGRPIEAMARLAAALRETAPTGVRERIPEAAAAPDLAAIARIALQNLGETALLVLDNVSEEGFADLVPTSPVQVLVTTRDQRLALGQATLLEVLLESDALDLAERLAGPVVEKSEAEARIRVVVEALGALAVAVEMAALSVKEWAGTWCDYEGHLLARAKELMEVREPHSRYPHSVTAALDLSIDRCESGSEARKLLEGISVFAPNGVPMTWAEAAAALDGTSVKTMRARATLKGLGLVSEDRKRMTLSMHRLVHARVRERAVEGRSVPWFERLMPWRRTAGDKETREHAWIEMSSRAANCVANYLNKMVGVERARIKDVEALQPHIWQGLAAAERAGLDREWIDIADRTARHLQHCALYDEARRLLQQALKRAEALHPPRPLRVGVSLNNLALVLHELGRAAEAQPLLERALAIDEKYHGPDHPSVATVLSNLALVFEALGRAAAVQPLLERALAITEKNYGPDHPSVAFALSRLAGLLLKLDRPKDAMPLLERALVIAEQGHGPEHPSVATYMLKKATALSSLDQVAEALPLFERSLDIAEKNYGSEHPVLTEHLAWLATTRMKLGLLESVRPLFERSLAIAEKTHGAHHPSVAFGLSRLGGALQTMGQSVEAIPLFERALIIAEKNDGSKHPTTAKYLSSLAVALQHLGRAAEALPLFERWLAISEERYGVEHTECTEIMAWLATARLKLGRKEDAHLLFERALLIDVKAYGPDHPKVARRLGNLAGALQELGRASEARLLLERALLISERVYGSEHPIVGVYLSRLAAVLQDLG